MSDGDIQIAEPKKLITEEALPFLRAADAYGVALDAGGLLLREWDCDIGMEKEKGALYGLSLFEAVDSAVMHIREEQENLSEMEDALGMSDATPASLHDPYAVDTTIPDEMTFPAHLNDYFRGHRFGEDVEDEDDEDFRSTESWDFVTDPDMESWTHQVPSERFPHSQAVENTVFRANIDTISGYIRDDIRDMTPPYFCQYIQFGFHKEYYNRWFEAMTERYFSGFSEEIADDLYNGKETWEDAFWEAVDCFSEPNVQLSFIEYVTQDMHETEIGRKKLRKLVDPEDPNNPSRNLLEMFTSDSLLTPENSVLDADISMAQDEYNSFGFGVVGERILIMLRKEIAASETVAGDDKDDLLQLAGHVVGTMIKAIDEFPRTDIDVYEDLNLGQNEVTELRETGTPPDSLQSTVDFQEYRVDPNSTAVVSTTSESAHDLFFRLGLMDWGLLSSETSVAGQRSPQGNPLFVLNCSLRMFGGVYVTRAVAEDDNLDISQTSVIVEVTVAIYDEARGAALGKRIEMAMKDGLTGRSKQIAKIGKTMAGVILDVFSAIQDFRTAHRRATLGQTDEAVAHTASGVTASIGMALAGAKKMGLVGGLLLVAMQKTVVGILVGLAVAALFAAWIAWVKTPELIVWIENTFLGTNQLESDVDWDSDQADLTAGFIEFRPPDTFDLGDDYWMFDHPDPTVSVTRQISRFMGMTSELSVEVQNGTDENPDGSDLVLSNLNAERYDELYICPIYSENDRFGYGIPLRIKLEKTLEATDGTPVTSKPSTHIAMAEDVEFVVTETIGEQIKDLTIHFPDRLDNHHHFFAPGHKWEEDDNKSDPEVYEICHATTEGMEGLMDDIGEIKITVDQEDSGGGVSVPESTKEDFLEALDILQTTPLIRTVVEP